MKRLQLKKRPQRQKFPFIINRLLPNILALALTFFILYASAVPTYTQTPTPTSRDAVITEIKQYAKRHVDSDSSLKTEFVVKQFQDNIVELTPQEIAKTYEEEYNLGSLALGSIVTST